jgi:uncharacterized tellurite resistance protein B-like protein
MSSYNTETPTTYIDEMSIDERKSFLKILAYLAASDGNFDEKEKQFIKDLSTIFSINKEDISSILEPSTVEEIIKEASNIKNRQAALQLIKEACLLANSDGDLSEQEVVFIGKIGQAMNVELEKIEQISQWVIDRIIWLEEGKIIFEQL